MRLTLMTAAALALTTGGAHAQLGGGGGISGGAGTTTGTAGQVGGQSGRVGSAGQAVATPGSGTGIGTGAATGARGRPGAQLQSVIPTSGAPRTGALGGESYERPGVPGRPRPATGAASGSASVTPAERALEQAGDAASGVGVSPSAFGSANTANSGTVGTTGSAGTSTGGPASGTLSPITPGNSVSGNANATGSVSPN